MRVPPRLPPAEGSGVLHQRTESPTRARICQRTLLGARSIDWQRPSIRSPKRGEAGMASRQDFTLCRNEQRPMHADGPVRFFQLLAEGHGRTS